MGWSTVWIRTRIALLLVTLLLGSGSVTSAEPETFKDQLAAYKSGLKSASFFERMWALRALARTREARALEQVVKDYGRLPEPRDQSQYFAASACATSFDAPDFVPQLEKWRTRNARPEHAWLWYQTLLVHARHAGAADLAAIATGRQHPYLRAAAVGALAALGLPDALPVSTAVLGALPKDDAQRTALLNSVAAILPSLAHEEGSAGRNGLARMLMDQLDDPLTSEASKVVIARYLQRAFDVPYAFTEAAPWRQVLASVQALMEIPSLGGVQVGRARLGGIRARGNRICYLIDLSEGGGREIAPWDEQLLAGEPADPSGAAAPAPGSSLRLLALREALHESLAQLAPEQAFAVVYYRHLDSDLVPGCTGMMPAIPRNVEDVMAGLVQLAPKQDADLHVGLMRAFSVTNKGFAKRQEYVDKTAILEGCDTIFVLAHSASVRDSWVAAGAEASEAMRMTAEGREVRGVYSDPAHLAEELRRWNLLRRAEIHAVAIGDAPQEEFRELFLPYRGWETMKGSEARRADDEAAGAEFEAVRRAYDAYLRRPSLFMRMRGRRRLARTHDPRALDILARSYARPEAPVDRVPHILASLCADQFTGPEHLPRFHAWREQHAEAKDAWLWYRTALLDLEHGAADAVERLAREPARPFLQVAAARAIATKRGPECVTLARDLLASLPAGGLERAAQVEAVAVLLQARGHMRSAPDFAAPAEALILELRNPALPLRTRLVIARHLARIFKTDAAHGLDADRWLRELKGAQASGTPPPEPRDAYAPFEFIGIPSAGGRVCYVIDASDSMLEPITDEDRRKLSKVVTGPGGTADGKDALPWDRIHNRFDVAREYLKLSLNQLTEDKSFSIVLFGTDAERLPSTPALVPATSTAVRAAIRDLDAIQPGPASPERPRGTLRGFTNMHGGLALAFRLTSGKLAGEDPYVDPQMLLEGVETVFLLSDGDPSTDDYRFVDQPDVGDTQADPETRAAQEKVPDVTYYGPYVDFDDYLVDDVRRMNLFRNAAIHCIGIGEANMVLLRLLAEAGLGEARHLGKD